MKRKVRLFLLFVLLTVTLGAMSVVSYEMYRLVSLKQDHELQAMEKILGDRFDTFVTMLRGEHNRITRHMDDVLPRIAAELEATGKAPGDLTTAELDTLTAKYNVQNIYFIDRGYKVFQTNLATDMNLQFPLDGEFRKFLDTVFGKGQVMSDGIDLSYSYVGPTGKDYVIETSTDVRREIEAGDFAWMSKFFFEDFFADAVRSNAYVKQLDMFLVNDAGYWSLIHVGGKLDPAIAAKVDEKGRYKSMAADGRLLTVYRKYRPPGVQENDPVAPKFVVSQITYDTGLADEAVFKVMGSALIVLLCALPVVFWIASRLLQKQLLDPLLTLRGEAGAIAGGDLERPIANTERRDEIGSLAASFDSMRGAVRRTIVDLKQTNLSIERFVPLAFLDRIGKPSIVHVELGDNTRKEMTILFSDIRNFTTLSEAMTPDENFDFINHYLENMGPVIRAHNGFIDKYIGDAIMALFDDPDDAVRASLTMIETLERYNEGRRLQGSDPVGIGIGLNTGSLMLGTIGEQHRMDGTVISDAVNLASRIESLTKTYKVGILISQFTRERLADPEAYDIRLVDTVTVKGKTHPVSLYEVRGRAA
jgi:class 3 adenylate cyclase